jgi:hypothetical protein
MCAASAWFSLVTWSELWKLQEQLQEYFMWTKFSSRSPNSKFLSPCDSPHFIQALHSIYLNVSPALRSKRVLQRIRGFGTFFTKVTFHSNSVTLERSFCSFLYLFGVYVCASMGKNFPLLEVNMLQKVPRSEKGIFTPQSVKCFQEAELCSQECGVAS